MKNKIDDNINSLRTAVTDSMAVIQQPIQDHISKLNTDRQKQVDKRDSTDAKRIDMISQLAVSDFDIKKITKLRTDYALADDAVYIYTAAIDQATQSLAQYQPVKTQLGRIPNSVMAITRLKILHAQLEVDGKATNIHAKQIDAELNAMNSKLQHLVKTMQGLDMDLEATGECLINLAESVIAFSPNTTNATQGVKIDKKTYLQNINHAI